jgi:hypothetical protein
MRPGCILQDMQVGLRSGGGSSEGVSLHRQMPGGHTLDDVMASQHREVAALREQMAALRHEMSAMRQGGAGPSLVSQPSLNQVSGRSTVVVCIGTFLLPMKIREAWALWVIPGLFNVQTCA